MAPSNRLTYTRLMYFSSKVGSKLTKLIHTTLGWTPIIDAFR